MAGVRVPLGVKVMLSYLAVIAAGALSLHLVLRSALLESGAAGLRRQLRQGAAILSDVLAATPAEQWPRRAVELAAMVPQRVAVFSADGRAVADSQPELGAEDLASAPEVTAALGTGAGTDTRVSPGLGVSVLHQAVSIPGPRGPRGVVRISARISEASAAEQAAVQSLGRAAATALSVALLLSFAAVLWVVRPLRRMRQAALALAHGELSVRVDVHSFDELEDLANALQAIGAQMKARLASGGGGEALLGQLVHAMVQGVVVLGAEGRVHHVNGVARVRLGLRGPQESERVSRLLACQAVNRAIAASVSDPHGVDMRVPHPVTGELIDGTVVALRRADGEPLFALILDASAQDALSAASDLPDPADVVAMPFRELMDRALRRVREDLEESAVSFTTPDEWPAASVAEVRGRVEHAVSQALLAAARSPGAQASAQLSATVNNGCVGLRLPVALGPDVVKALEPRLAPLGGRVEAGPGMVQLWLPRA